MGDGTRARAIALGLMLSVAVVMVLLQPGNEMVDRTGGILGADGVLRTVLYAGGGYDPTMPSPMDGEMTSSPASSAGLSTAGGLMCNGQEGENGCGRRMTGDLWSEAEKGVDRLYMGASQAPPKDAAQTALDRQEPYTVPEDSAGGDSSAQGRGQNGQGNGVMESRESDTARSDLGGESAQTRERGNSPSGLGIHQGSAASVSAANGPDVAGHAHDDARGSDALDRGIAQAKMDVNIASEFEQNAATSEQEQAQVARQPLASGDDQHTQVVANGGESEGSTTRTNTNQHAARAKSDQDRSGDVSGGDLSRWGRMLEVKAVWKALQHVQGEVSDIAATVHALVADKPHEYTQAQVASAQPAAGEASSPEGERGSGQQASALPQMVAHQHAGSTSQATGLPSSAAEGDKSASTVSEAMKRIAGKLNPVAVVASSSPAVNARSSPNAVTAGSPLIAQGASLGLLGNVGGWSGAVGELQFGATAPEWSTQGVQGRYARSKDGTVAHLSTDTSPRAAYVRQLARLIDTQKIRPLSLHPHNLPLFTRDLNRQKSDNDASQPHLPPLIWDQLVRKPMETGLMYREREAQKAVEAALPAAQAARKEVLSIESTAAGKTPGLVL